MSWKIILAAIAVIAVAALFFIVPRSARQTGGTAALVGPKVDLAMGLELFGKNCLKCHGPGAQGGGQGPLLVHRIYEPNHHADAAFYLAVQRGVRQHHWRFGNMPPVPGVSQADVTHILGYVRSLQKKAGIF